MADFLIKPVFSQTTNAIFFQTDPLNALLAERYNDKFGVYQSNYGVYSYMNYTSNLTFRIHYLQGTPLLFQPHNSCAWTPTGTVSTATDEIVPCRAKINEQHCYDEYMEGTFKDLIRYNTGPTIQLSPAGVRMNNLLIRNIMKNATMGARLTLSAGQLFDPAVVSFEDGVNARIESAFRQTWGTCRGWIELLRTRASEPGLSYLDGGYIDAGDISADGKTYTGAVTGDAVALYDEIMAAAPQALADSIIEGGVGGFGASFYPLFIVSPSIYRAVHEAWLAQKESALMNMPRISTEQLTINTERGARQVNVYKIDDTIVVPLSEISQMTQFLTGTAHFAYLTISGVIQLGANFASLPVVNQSEVSIMVQLSSDAEDFGTYKFLNHSNFATAINDVSYIAGDYLYAEPA